MKIGDLVRKKDMSASHTEWGSLIDDYGIVTAIRPFKDVANIVTVYFVVKGGSHAFPDHLLEVVSSH